MAAFIELAKERYSVRSFSQRQVEQRKIDAVLEAGRIAPTACNNQPQRIKVITSPDDLAKTDECTSCRFGAPVVLMVCYDRRVCWRRRFDGALSGETDAAIVTTHMMLAAQELGLGTCWVMHFDPAKASERFELPADIVPAAMLCAGYPAEDAAPSDRHDKRQALEQILL